MKSITFAHALQNAYYMVVIAHPDSYREVRAKTLKDFGFLKLIHGGCSSVG
ncbi:hypothetical protein Q4Q35_07045 [Flavivirga aquimarina]|uniref:Uncharacterized protein n=1 Tax=Flavivirga aquimarina TaxID=2027862 RepID=A0ABT8W8W0_9FLAO|nr:hypothetical protein [Flavivirga aquimarina]MDO5969558.1 hypothetical protein [Flavivirga aquimarina]